jgi:hypothetical protein
MENSTKLEDILINNEANLKNKIICISQKFCKSYEEELFRLQIKNLNIDYKYCKFYYKSNKVIEIQLRKIDYTKKKLIIGCGNNPTSKIYKNGR